MYLLNPRIDWAQDKNGEFTFHYVSIKSPPFKPQRKRREDLHSTMYLLNLIDNR